MDDHTIETGLAHLAAAVAVPDLPLHAAPDVQHLPQHVARRMIADELGLAGDLGLYGGALPSILAERLLAPEIYALAAAMRALAAYVPDPDDGQPCACCGQGHRLEAL